MSTKGDEPLSLAAAARLEAGTEVKVYALIQSLGRGRTANGKPYLDLVLVDASGTLRGKVWSDAKAFEAASPLAAGAVVVAWGRMGEFQGPQLSLSELRLAEAVSEERRVWLYGEALDEAEPYGAKTVAFDIETVPAGTLDDLPQSLRRRLDEHARRGLRRDGLGETAEAVAERVRLERSTNPLLGRIVSLSLIDAESETGRVVVAAEKIVSGVLAGAGIHLVSEARLLAVYWRVARYAERLVSFNGVEFDVPFLQARSLILGVSPGIDFGPRGSLANHVDLRDRLRLGGSGHLGSLELACWAFGIAGPKGEHSGGDVEGLYQTGHYEELARYNLGDARATLALWRSLSGL